VRAAGSVGPKKRSATTTPKVKAPTRARRLRLNPPRGTAATFPGDETSSSPRDTGCAAFESRPRATCTDTAREMACPADAAVAVGTDPPDGSSVPTGALRRAGRRSDTAVQNAHCAAHPCRDRRRGSTS
jgi:hypothetical protein